MKKTTKTKNKKLLLIVLIGLIITICIIVTLILINRKPRVEVRLNDNLTFEVNTEVNLLDLISKDNEAEIISKDEKIDTSKLGDQELVVIYKEKKEEKEYKFKINIVDTTSPVIEASS